MFNLNHDMFKPAVRSYPKIHMFGGVRRDDETKPEFMHKSWLLMDTVNENSGLDNYIVPIKGHPPQENSSYTILPGAKLILYFLDAASCIRLREIHRDEKLEDFSRENYVPVYAHENFHKYHQNQTPLPATRRLCKVDPNSPQCMEQAWKYMETVSEASDLANHIFPVQVCYAENYASDYNMEVLFKEANEPKKDSSTYVVTKTFTEKLGGKSFIYRLHVRNPNPLQPYEPENFDSRFKFWKIRTVQRRDSFDVKN